MAEPDVSESRAEWAVTRLHNAMVILEVGDATILTDPWFADSRAFRGCSPIGVRDLPELTAIIGCHGVGDHWGMGQMADYPHKDVPVYACTDHMVDEARKYGFTSVENLAWGEHRALTDSVTLHAVADHARGERRTNDYAIIGPGTRVFFGGEALDLAAIGTCGRELGPFDVAIGPVNGVHLMGRQLTTTAQEMLEATRLLGAGTLVPVHDEHRSFRPLLRIASSVRDLDLVAHDDVDVVELAFGERYAHPVR